MKTLSVKDIIEPIAEQIKFSLVHVEESVCAILKNLNESSPSAKWALDQIIENNAFAITDNSPACQDTGMAVFFLEVGQDLHLIDGYIEDAINEAVRIAYAEHRKSILHPLTRKNTQDNTPAIINTRIVPGDILRVSFLAKGAGSENMSALYMLTPSKGREGIISCVVDCVKKAGANPCPPIIIGVGVGGDIEKACEMAKFALLRPTGQFSSEPDNSDLEKDILREVNKLGIGIQGFGGNNTALSVAVETCPTHIGMLPVAVNIQCHSVRHFTLEF